MKFVDEMVVIFVFLSVFVKSVEMNNRQDDEFGLLTWKY